jgi:hypothetical protein
MARPRATFPRPVPRRRPAPGAAASLAGTLGLRPGDAVVVYLHSPREKVYGILLAVDAPGVTTRCIDLATFDDWMRQEARREEQHLGPATIFYPMGRVERIERDETIGPVISLYERFFREVGRTVHASMGFAIPRPR